MVQGLGIRVQGSGIRVYGLGPTKPKVVYFIDSLGSRIVSFVDFGARSRWSCSWMYWMFQPNSAIVDSLWRLQGRCTTILMLRVPGRSL